MMVGKSLSNNIRRVDKFGGWLQCNVACDFCGQAHLHRVYIGPDEKPPSYVFCPHCDYPNIIGNPPQESEAPL